LGRIVAPYENSDDEELEVKNEKRDKPRIKIMNGILKIV
jgi:hypothetical protein